MADAEDKCPKCGATLIALMQTNATSERLADAEELLEQLRDAIKVVASAGGGSFSRHVLPLFRDVVQFIGPQDNP